MSQTLDTLEYLACATRFRHISERLYVDGDRLYKEAGLNFKASWFPVYYVLALSESPLTILQIAKRIDFSHITVKNVIRELEAAELVTVEPNPDDGRSKLVALTLKGQKLIYRLKPIWISLAGALKEIFQYGHPDFINILNRMEHQLEQHSIHRLAAQEERESVVVVDYNPGLAKHFFELEGPWLTEEENGSLKEEGGISLSKPDEAHFIEGGFLFYARYKSQIVGFAALKRLDDQSFEFANLFINPIYRNLGVEHKLIGRCICRCKENEALELWLQTNETIPDHLKIFEEMGFVERAAPEQLKVQEETKKVMCLDL
jgi:DNA-binding MarR family transcriptional regulator/N-acetylglutamate synthase-like GNAT family acetyltransferase